MCKLTTLSLRGKIQLLIAGIVVALSGSMFLGISVLTNRQIDSSLRIDGRAAAKLLGVLITEKSDGLSNQCFLLARQPGLRAVIGTHDTPTISDSLNDYIGQLDATCAVITDSDGRRLGAAGQIIPAENVCLPGVRSAILNNHWSGIISADSRLFVAVTVPVYNGSDLWGTLSAYRLIDSHVATELKSVIGADVAFVSSGRIADASLSSMRGMELSDHAESVVNVGGSHYLAISTPLPLAGESNLYLLTMLSYETTIREYRTFEEMLAGLVAATLCLALALGSSISHSLIRPLGNVVEAAKVLQRGEWPEPFSTPGEDEVGLLQTVFNDMIATLYQNQKRLESLIDTDLLTGLDNHRRFQERLAQETYRSATSGERLSILLCDIDHFKEYNRREGLAKGDKGVAAVASAIRSVAPDVSVLSRYGGNEFAVLIIGSSISEAYAAAERIIAEVAKLKDGLTLSIGCAQLGEHLSNAEGLMLAAKLALSRAKQLGRNQACLFDSIPGAEEMADPYQLHKFLNDGSLATIQTLAAAVDAKDPYTRGHSANVARYSRDLAAYMGLSNKLVDLIHITGTLHDVGKIGVPDAILKKPGKLTAEERLVMETHPVLGEIIVKKAPQLLDTLPGVRGHHERWDGNGYPDRLIGADIPLIARILAVADTFDAMTSDRPYRKGLPAEYALKQINEGGGSQFDPEIAEAFIALMQSQSEWKSAA